MPHARNIKHSFFMNEELGSADPILPLLFAGLWCLADREGILEDRPPRIKAELFPYREHLDINGYLTDLYRMGFIIRYDVNGSRFIWIPNFLKHQNPHHTEKRSSYPKPEPPMKSMGCDLTVSQPLPTIQYPADSLIPDSLIPDVRAPKKKVKIPKVDVYGDYPPEMEEGRTVWRGMLKSLREMQDQFPDHGKYIASAVGTSELTWQAWQKHLGRVVKGTTEKVTNQDILEGVKIWAMEGMRRAQSKTSLSAKMLPSLLNSPDFVDAVIMAVKKRSCSQEVQNAV